MTKPDPKDMLRAHRSNIDRLDAKLVETLAERFTQTRMVGQLKADHDLPESDPEREAWQLKRLHKLASESDLDPDFVSKLLKLIFEEVVRNHKQFRV